MALAIPGDISYERIRTARVGLSHVYPKRKIHFDEREGDVLKKIWRCFEKRRRHLKDIRKHFEKKKETFSKRDKQTLFKEGERYILRERTIKYLIKRETF